MSVILRRSLQLSLAAAIALLPSYLPVFAQGQDQSGQSSGQSSGQDQSGSQTGQQPSTQPPSTDSTKPDSTKQDPQQTDKSKQTNKNNGQEPSRDAPIQQQDTVHPKNSKQDVDQIGQRKLGGFNMHSMETDIAIGKQYAQEVERSSKLIDDPIVVEYVNRVGQ
ncbi:MAG TPA: hypothetical protein VEU98_11175, partial [Candidatus Eremiobacteraceae bacterium]|nr:hypothetical protein [Candidatus Eremiobacteraceae bacterium]